MGCRPKGVRIDSGDIAYLTKKMRKMLDDAGYPDCKITASNSLDEYIIRDTLMQGAKIDSFGVGERLITSLSSPVFGGVYKLAAIESDGEIVPRIKISENTTKITNPGFKQLFRLYSNESGEAVADVIALYDEEIDESQPYEIFDPDHTWKRKKLSNFHAKKLLVQLFEKGKCVYESPDVHELKKYCAEQIDKLWDEVKRFENPHKYYVDLSPRLWKMKEELLEQYSG